MNNVCKQLFRIEQSINRYFLLILHVIVSIVGKKKKNSRREA